MSHKVLILQDGSKISVGGVVNLFIRKKAFFLINYNLLSVFWRVTVTIAFPRGCLYINMAHHFKNVFSKALLVKGQIITGVKILLVFKTIFVNLKEVTFFLNRSIFNLKVKTSRLKHPFNKFL